MHIGHVTYESCHAFVLFVDASSSWLLSEAVLQTQKLNFGVSLFLP